MFAPPPGATTGATVQINAVEKFSCVCQTMRLTAFPFDNQSCILQLEFDDLINGWFTNFLIEPGNLYWQAIVSNDEWKVNNITWDYLPSMTYGDAHYGFAVTFSMSRNSYYYMISIVSPAVILQLVAADRPYHV
jgi:hypothetical protein